MSHEQGLTPVDAESEACFTAVVEIIADEIRSRVGVHDDDVLDSTWAARVATVAADALLDSFRFRPLVDGERRWARD